MTKVIDIVSFMFRGLGNHGPSVARKALTPSHRPEYSKRSQGRTGRRKASIEIGFVDSNWA